MTSENENTSPEQGPAPIESPNIPQQPPDRIETHGDPGPRPSKNPTPGPDIEKRER